MPATKSMYPATTINTVSHYFSSFADVVCLSLFYCVHYSADITKPLFCKHKFNLKILEFENLKIVSTIIFPVNIYPENKHTQHNHHHQLNKSNSCKMIDSITVCYNSHQIIHKHITN